MLDWLAQLQTGRGTNSGREETGDATMRTEGKYHDWLLYRLWQPTTSTGKRKLNTRLWVPHIKFAPAIAGLQQCLIKMWRILGGIVPLSSFHQPSSANHRNGKGQKKKRRGEAKQSHKPRWARRRRCPVDETDCRMVGEASKVSSSGKKEKNENET